MKQPWPEVALREIAQPVSRVVPVLAGQPYRTIGVKWWGEGAYERETIDGSRTAAKTLSLVREGDLIINKIWVRHGSTAIALSAVDGCAASGEFPTFQLDRDRVCPKWIHWQTKTPRFWAKCDALSRGTSGKNRIKPELFLTIRIPLPSLAEQRKLLERIDEIAENIEEARRLRTEAEDDVQALCRSILRSDDSPKLTPMSDLVRLRPADVTVRADEIYQFAGVYSFGRGVFRSQSKSGMEFAYQRLTRLRSGNFVYPKLMAWEGALAVVPPECDGFVVSTEFPVFEVIEDRVYPEVLDTYFRDPSVWSSVSGASTGTNVRRRRLHPSDFLNFQMPLPSKAVQERLRTIKRELKKLEPLQVPAAAELDALMPSVLTRAFEGEL